MIMRRVAFMGAAGTGKTTLATLVAEKLQIPYMTVGSRSVAKEMGFDSPYYVDNAGKRAEFQKLLMQSKQASELLHHEFVTDRTVLDNLAYTLMHLFQSDKMDQMDELFWKTPRDHMQRYTVVCWCPLKEFYSGEADGVRKTDYNYHRLYESILLGLFHEMYSGGYPFRWVTVKGNVLENRLCQVLDACYTP